MILISFRISFGTVLCTPQSDLGCQQAVEKLHPEETEREMNVEYEREMNVSEKQMRREIEKRRGEVIEEEHTAITRRVCTV